MENDDEELDGMVMFEIKSSSHEEIRSVALLKMKIMLE
jgi:hypothetical protein